MPGQLRKLQEAQHSYFVLKLDLNPEQPTVESFQSTLNDGFISFRESYHLEFDIYVNDFKKTFQNLITAIKSQQERPHKLMVLIDEYDRLANRLIADDPNGYEQLVRYKGKSPICALFETLQYFQTAKHGLVDYRSFATGISPIALAAASGGNVWKNASFDHRVAEAVGFNQQHVQCAITRVTFDPQQQTVLAEYMKRYFNGYLFPRATQHLFNSTQVIGFLLDFQSDAGDIITRIDQNPPPDPDPNLELSDSVFNILRSSPSTGGILVLLLQDQPSDVDIGMLTVQMPQLLAPVRVCRSRETLRDRVVSNC